MEDNFEKQLVKALNEEKEMPSLVRISLDSTYDRIRTLPKKKNKSVLKIVAAVCCIVIAGTLASNESVRAGIKTFFNFNDEGIEKAVNNGFINETSNSDYDNGIKATLDSYFADSNKIGFSIKLKFEDLKMLSGVDKVSLDYRIKNGDGEYIVESIPDTKPLKGRSQYMCSSIEQNSEFDVKNSEVQYDEINESNKGGIPKLENAVIEVETVKFFKDNTMLKGIDGTWNLKLNEGKPISVNSVEYKAKNNTSKIEIISAKSSPTSFNIIFAVDGKYEDENTFAGENMKLLDENGKEYKFNGYGMDFKDNKTIVSTNFSLSSYDNIDKLKLIISSIGEVELEK